MALRLSGAKQNDYGAERGIVGLSGHPKTRGRKQVSGFQSAAADARPFLRVPPFPGATATSWQGPDFGAPDCPADLIDLIKAHRVGGTYWAAQPDLPPRYVLACSPSAVAAALELGDDPVVLWEANGSDVDASGAERVITGQCDPWHMLAGASSLVVEQSDDIHIVAAILDIPTYIHDDTTGRVERCIDDGSKLVSEALPYGGVVNPFTGEAMGLQEAVELSGFWRGLIDSNRGIAGGIGFAFWKQDNVASLLWDGSKPFDFLKAAPANCRAPVAVWRSKAAPELLAQLARDDVPLIEVEDGFLRSQGLGANCVPPLSLTFDRLGAYFDHTAPSELENLLQNGSLDEQLLHRARQLRSLIVEAGLGKYERGFAVVNRPGGDRLHILVPGQVDDDRSVQTGGGGLLNLDLLARVREQAPEACIIYKPHPDVVAGHRKGAISDRACLRYADKIVGDASISSLIAMVDEVHVNTSQTGFEALLQGKPVTTYGVPFYAGWGLTRDLGPVPARRSARRTVDELVAAALLIYPRYLDPVTGLPCPAEVVVQRLCEDDRKDAGVVVAARRLQGKLMRGFRKLAS